MPESLQRILAEAKAGKYSSINNLSEDDVANVWENVGNYIEKKMASQKGVQIPHFGSFCFSQNKLDVGNNKFVLMQRPVFNISEKFAQNLGLQFTRYNVPGHIPCQPLNYAALSFESPFDRDTVESCVREIVQSVTRAVAAKKNVELTFAGIGRLQIRDSRVKMRFYKDFINQMDGSGELLDSMQNRAGTVDSVMSNRPFSRPHTSNTVLLPKIQASATGSNALPPLAEEDETQNTQPAAQEDSSAEGPPVTQELGPAAEGEASQAEGLGEGTEGEGEATNIGVESGDQGAGTVENPLVKDTEVPTERKMVPPSRGPSRAAMPMAMACGVSLLDDLVPKSPAPKPPSPPSPPPRAATNADMPLGAPKALKPPTPPRLAPLNRSRSTEDMLGQRTLVEKRANAGSACGHFYQGKELCNLCHQRARRNIPVYFTEERKRREEEEDRVLQQYQSMKDAEDTFKEQDRHIARRHDLQKISAFNLGIAEVVNAKKKAKDKNPQRSYIFQRRPLTPSRLPKQEEYLKELTDQVEGRKEASIKVKTDEDFMGRLEQVQLAEDLAAQRDQFIKDKEEQVNMYKNALDAQMRFKPLPIPPRQSDNEVFGKNDTTNEMLMEKRRRAHLLFQEQQELSGQRKREAILKRLSEQSRDQVVLEKTKQGLREDRAHRHKTRVHHRQQLEHDWKSAADAKKARDLEDRLLGLESGQLVQDQCNHYHRCQQCERRTNNCGETNIWSESYFIPGCRIMV